MSKEVKVRYYKVNGIKYEKFVAAIRYIVSINDRKSNILDGYQAIISKDEGDKLFFKFNKERDISPTLRDTNGSDSEATPPEGSEYTETMYACVYKNILVVLGTHYPPSPQSFRSYLSDLYDIKKAISNAEITKEINAEITKEITKEINKEDVDKLYFEDIYDKGLYDKIKKANWKSFTMNIAVAGVPDSEISSDAMFGFAILEGKRLQSKSVMIGVSGGVINTLKNFVLDMASYATSASVRADGYSELFNLLNYRKVYSEKIGKGSSLFVENINILERAINHYNN